MADDSDWIVLLKIIFNTSCSPLNKCDLLIFGDRINKRSNELIDGNRVTDSWQGSFVAVAAYHFSGLPQELQHGEVGVISSASEVLLKCLLDQLIQCAGKASLEDVVEMIKGICTGTQCLSTARLKLHLAKLREELPSNLNVDETLDDVTLSSVVGDSKRLRLDTGKDIFSRLTTVFDVASGAKFVGSGVWPVTPEAESAASGGIDSHAVAGRSVVIERNTLALVQLGGGEVLLKHCLQLPYLQRSVKRIEQTLSTGDLTFIASTDECASAIAKLRVLTTDLQVVSDVLSLPIMEPLVPARVQQVAVLALACLHAAEEMVIAVSVPQSQAVGSQKMNNHDTDLEQCAATIVESALTILANVVAALKASSRVSTGTVYNVHTLMTWCLLRSLEHLHTCSGQVLGDKSQPKHKIKEAPVKPNSMQMTSPLVLLTSHLLDKLSLLMSDRQQEMLTSQATQGGGGGCKMVSLAGDYSAAERLSSLLSSTNVVTILVSLLHAAFRKAFSVKLVVDTEPANISGSSTYDLEHSCSDNSDDETESMFGQLFEVDSGAKIQTRVVREMPTDADNEVKGVVMAIDRARPEAFVKIATDILTFLTASIASSSDFREYYRSSVTDQQLCQLSAIIQDIDIGVDDAGGLYEHMSSAVAHFIHTLLSNTILSLTYQNTLLSQLGMSLSPSDRWPLNIRARTLSVLAEVLLLRQQDERQATDKKTATEQLIADLWLRFVHSCEENALRLATDSVVSEDVNMEHVQLLLLLLHSLQMNQRKALLLQLAQVIVRVSDILAQRLSQVLPLPLSRLLLIFDYLLHYFYDPPACLFDQVQYNLFGRFSSTGKQDTKGEGQGYFVCREVEDNYQRHFAAQPGKGTQSVRFYQLTPPDHSLQETPKVDGLACSFLLSSADVVSYAKVYDACLRLLSAGMSYEPSADGSKSFELCCVHYHVLICWHLLSSLPPSVQYLRNLGDLALPLSDISILNNLRWRDRLATRTFHLWVKDYVVKQGLTSNQADILLSTLTTPPYSYHASIATLHLSQLSKLSAESVELSRPMTLIVLDAVVGRTCVALDALFSKSMNEPDPFKPMAECHVDDLLLAACTLIGQLTALSRRCVLEQTQLDSDTKAACANVMAMGSTRTSRVASLARALMDLLPPSVRSSVDAWNSRPISEFPAIGAWRSSFANDQIPGETYTDAVVSAHLAILSGQQPYSITGTVKHCLLSLVNICRELHTWAQMAHTEEMTQALLPLTLEVSTDHVADFVLAVLEASASSVTETDPFSVQLMGAVVSQCHTVIRAHVSAPSVLDERVACECIQYMETSLDKPAFKQALRLFYADSTHLVAVLMTSASGSVSEMYVIRILNFVHRLLQLSDQAPDDADYKALCASLRHIADVDPLQLQAWLRRVTVETGKETQTVENRNLLKNITAYVIKENSMLGPTVASALLRALIPIATGLLLPPSRGLGLAQLMVVLEDLAGAGSGSGHVDLSRAAIGWLQMCVSDMAPSDGDTSVTQEPLPKAGVECMTCLLDYVDSIQGCLKQSMDRSGAVSPPYDHDTAVTEGESEWLDELQDDDDSALDDSDDEGLNSKLCTFTITQKDFMNQHWYHCYTCKMVDSVGVCTVCAKVCHRGHDLTYAKYGSFFCDCGAREDGSCQALAKRSSHGRSGGVESTGGRAVTSSRTGGETALTSSLRKRASPPGDKKTDSVKADIARRTSRTIICRQLDAIKDSLTSNLQGGHVVSTTVDLLHQLMSPVTHIYERLSSKDSVDSASKALDDVRTQTKTVDNSDSLMVAMLGSQEGAFENIKVTYTGDQGQTIRHLLSTHVLYRVAMCCLSSPQGRHQHLAVCSEKSKVTLLQLNALLRQTDTTKRKLTLTKLATAPVPFTILSITGNPCNEDFLAVCGLKDCHVLSFNSYGTVTNHLVLQPALDAGNFIIKAMWLPGSQTELALVTADFVKVYDLGQDAISPMYYFLLPSSKIRDATFVTVSDVRYLVLMPASGYIYYEKMDDSSRASNGPFYITNSIEVNHAELKEAGGLVAGGGVSVHYSHALQLLFFSYAHGKTFAASLTKDLSSTEELFAIVYKTGNGSKSAVNTQPLVQWAEVSRHPGLVCCMTQTSNNPVVLFVKPDTILVQELKPPQTKAKVQNMVLLWHELSAGEQRTTLIVLFEDGSLRIYVASPDATNFWLRSSTPASSAVGAVATVARAEKKRKLPKMGRQSSQINFPVDFFEHCQPTADVEFSGRDLLHVYNTAQLKHRLTNNGLYVASTKPGGFTIEVTNTNSNNVIVGLRIYVGGQSVERAPTFIEIFGRSIQMNTNRARPFDIPLTREESVSAEKKLSIFVGPSHDPAGVTMVDSVKIFVKTKDQFGWQDDADDVVDVPAASVKTPIPAAVPALADLDRGQPLALAPLSPVDKLLSSSLEVLNSCCSLIGLTADEGGQKRQELMDMVSHLITLPLPPSLHHKTKSLLASLFTNATDYHTHKDLVQLAYVVESVRSHEAGGAQLVPDTFLHILTLLKAIARSRPSNIVTFAETHPITGPESGSGQVSDSEKLTNGSKFMDTLSGILWQFILARPANPVLAPACLPGLSHVEVAIGCLVDVIHAFTVHNSAYISKAVSVYMLLLLAKDTQISFACKQALTQVLRPHHKHKKVFIPSPPRCSTPDGGTPGGDDDDDDGEDKKNKRVSLPHDLPASQADSPSDDTDAHYDIVVPDETEMEQEDSGQPDSLVGLLAGAAMLDLPPGVDEETMMEMAITLSLQEQQQGQAANGGNFSMARMEDMLSGVGLMGHFSAQQLQEHDLQNQAQSLDAGHMSDTTASPPASDDEASSMLHPSPAEHGAGFESGASAIDSASVSGRSSAVADILSGGVRGETGAGVPSAPSSLPFSQSSPASELGPHQQLLDEFITFIPQLRDINGMRVIPYLQVVLVLAADMSTDVERERATLDTLISALLAQLSLTQVEDLTRRTPAHEVQQVILRVFSALISRSKSSSSSGVCAVVGQALSKKNLVGTCQTVLETMISVLKARPANEPETTVVPAQLLRARPSTPLPDLTPFLQRTQVKEHMSDVFEDYDNLLLETTLRLLYQMKKLADGRFQLAVTFDTRLQHLLAEYMMVSMSTSLRKLVRKLLLNLCGSQEVCRQVRDLHLLDTHMSQVLTACSQSGLDIANLDREAANLNYDLIILLIEHLRTCGEVASTRKENWQLFCQRNTNVLPTLVLASVSVDENVASAMLHLLQYALHCSRSDPRKAKTDAVAKPHDKTEASEDSHHDPQCQALVQQVCQAVPRQLMVRFIRTFLLESNVTSIRWQTHSLVHHMYSAAINQQEPLVDIMWSLWPELPSYGRKAAQFVDLLGYFLLKAPQLTENRSHSYLERLVLLLRQQNRMLAAHPNGAIYNSLHGLVDFDGYYLESEPCLVCNNPELPYSTIKLASVKTDSKFSTTTQIVKLVGSYLISKIVVRITDIKRTKMVRTMNIYYNNRSVQAVVELKNRPGLWIRAKRIVLTPGQTEVKGEFLVPIVACNLMIEFADFYENVQASAETLQCPRCSAAVPAKPGVCSNCNENVFQCHKCRAINYDEKEPFLCNACGYCKYAKFDFSLLAKPSSAVDPIDNDEDRKKTLSTINSLLEKADKLYKQLQASKPLLETLLAQLSDHGPMQEEGGPRTAASVVAASASLTAPGGGGAGGGVNKAIQQLAQRYCNECHHVFDELSKIIQKVVACRRGLMEFDRKQLETALRSAASLPASTSSTPSDVLRQLPKAVEVVSCDQSRSRLSQCYGCASATVEHCVTLLRAFSMNANIKTFLCQQGLINELVQYNLRRSSAQFRTEVRQLLCQLIRNSAAATDELNAILIQRIMSAMDDYQTNPDFMAAVRHEVGLLTRSAQVEDNCWEQRVRAVMKLLLHSIQLQSPIVMEAVALPCLKVLHQLIKPDSAASRKNKDKPVDSLCTVRMVTEDLHVNLAAWLRGEASASFQNWRHNMPKKGSEVATKKKRSDKDKEKVRDDHERRVVRVKYLTEKYGLRWLRKHYLTKTSRLVLSDKSWLRKALLSTSSRSMRQSACNIVEMVCQNPLRKRQVLDMLCKLLPEVIQYGEASAEYLSLFKNLIGDTQSRYYLAVKGVPLSIGQLIMQETDKLSSLEGTTMNTDLSQGFALKSLTELLVIFAEEVTIRQHLKSRLVGNVLDSYLALRKLLMQRTKMVDETQDKLLELLQQMTAGTEAEMKEFMAVCVKAVDKFPQSDFVSPVFIFERLCNIIIPEANEVSEFLLSLEKDPHQEDFLQGRMLGNPYNANEPGLGPLMRDVKNKICTDCELVALLEDDTGMELLVSNKIINLELPVKDVYKKIWLPEHAEGEPMRVVYRMRGLLGDATEDMVNTLDTAKDEEKDEEQVYKRAAVMSECGGLHMMLLRLSAIRDLVLGKQMMLALLKLLSYCVKVKANRLQLIREKMNTFSIMLGALNLALLAEQEGGVSTKGQTLTEQVLVVLETVLHEASLQPPEVYREFSQSGDCSQLLLLLDRINSPFVRANSSVLQALMRLIPFLAFGDEQKMDALIDHFRTYMNFDRFDREHTENDQIHLDCLCVIVSGIQMNANGVRLKDLIVKQGVVQNALDYVRCHAPLVKAILPVDADEWKDFLAKPSLPYVLRLLTGLCVGHTKTQVLFAEDVINILHKLEQVSSEGHVGSLAENLLEALKEEPHVAQTIDNVRATTRAEKKRMAMAKRQKQLDALGMTTNEKGQVTVTRPVVRQTSDMKEETGLVCSICREGYHNQPTKVLGVYTFSKRVNVDDYEAKQRKLQGYSTVSHFNVIHVDCHEAAVKQARGREEWESAALHNTNTKCNGLLPMWGPQVSESDFAARLARHNSYLLECTGVRDTSYYYAIHDIKHLLLFFACEKSFSDDTGGGGRQSNAHLLPYLMHLALYTINTTRSVVREERSLTAFLALPVDKWVESSFEVDGVLYWLVMAMHLFDTDRWKAHSKRMLQQVIILAQARHLSPAGTTSLSDKSVKDYAVYKPYLMFYALTTSIISVLFKGVSQVKDTTWSASLAEYIRHHDTQLLEQATRLVQRFESELLVCESFAELIDTLGLLDEISDAENFVRDSLALLP